MAEAEKKLFTVKVIHVFKDIEAENEDEACDIVCKKDGYGEALDCTLEAEEQ